MSRTAIFLLVVVAATVVFALSQRSTAQLQAAQIQSLEQQLAAERAGSAELRDKLERAEQERDKFQKEAAEVHRLRGEISTARNANKVLEQQAAQARAAKAAPPTPQASAAAPTAFTPPSFGNYGEMGKFVGGLRAKAFGGGPLSPEERQYLQSLKPDLEKLERSPTDFAAFQTELIQSAAGITDPEKTEKIRQTIQRVYENAVSRGLDIPARPSDDLNWVEDRFRLDRRGTQAVQGVLSEEERAAFDKQFIGIMGVDLGTGVDKGLYPRGFLGDAK